VYIAYDRDEAGDKAAAKLAGELMEMGIECFRVEFPKGMDANEYALKVTPAAKSLGVLLNRASWLGKGQRPEQRVAVPEIAAAPEPVATVKEERAAKEKMIEEPEPMPAAAAAAIENVLPLAAEPELVAPMPFASPADVAVEMRGEDVLMRFGDREYRVRGLQKNMSGDILRVNLRVMGVA
jgi:DNA primase